MRTSRSVIAALACGIFAACGNADSGALADPVAFDIPVTAEVTGPRLSQAPDGGLVLSWMEARD
ncbi:MAG: hypothetical protein KJO56_03150, partial [Gammaproteobacteria bacterium]|nr:hypothetical protein [Gammaproteobacteria bacterium]